MNTADQYIQAVLHEIHLPQAERQRIETDLRAHLEEATLSGEPIQAAIDRMGSPEEVAAAFMSQVQMVYAGFWKRLLAYLIDLLLIAIPIPLLAGLGFLSQSVIPARAATPTETIVGALGLIGLFTAGLLILSLFLLYFPILEGRFGQTLGKRLLKLRVLKENGQAAGYREAILRRVSFFFDFFPIDALFIFFTEKKQRGFDVIARTVVVDEAKPWAARND